MNKISDNLSNPGELKKLYQNYTEENKEIPPLENEHLKKNYLKNSHGLKNDEKNDEKKETEIVIPIYSSKKSKANDKKFFTPNNQVLRSGSPDSNNPKTSIPSPKYKRNANSLSGKKYNQNSAEKEENKPRDLLPKPSTDDRNSYSYIQEILRKKLEIKQQIKYLDDQIIELEGSFGEKDILELEKVEKVEAIKENLNDLFLTDIENEKKPLNTRVLPKKTKKSPPPPPRRISKSNDTKSSYKDRTKRSPEPDSFIPRVPIHERNKKWEMKRQERLQKEREKKTNEQMVECTFKPKLKVTKKKLVTPKKASHPVDYYGNPTIDQITPIDRRNVTDSFNEENNDQFNINHANPDVKEIIGLFQQIQKSLKEKETIDKGTKRVNSKKIFYDLKEKSRGMKEEIIEIIDNFN